MLPSPLTSSCALSGVLLLAACATTPEVAACKTYCATRDDGYQWAQSAHLLDAAACEQYGKEFKAGCRLAVTDAQQSNNPRDSY